MRCPICQLPLIGVERDRVEVEHCPQCRGLWFEDGELRQLAAATGRPEAVPHPEDLEPAETRQKPRPCPRCEGKMEQVFLDSGRRVVVDRCAGGDGLWFDAGELGAFLSQAGSETDPGRRLVARFLGESFGEPPHTP